MRNTSRLFLVIAMGSVIATVLYFGFALALAALLQKPSVPRIVQGVGVAVTVLVPICLAAFWIFRKLQAEYTRREARAAAITLEVHSSCFWWAPRDGRWIEEAVAKKIKKYRDGTVSRKLLLVIDGLVHLDSEQLTAFRASNRAEQIPFLRTLGRNNGQGASGLISVRDGQRCRGFLTMVRQSPCHASKKEIASGNRSPSL